MAIAVGLLVIALVVFAEGIHALVVAPPDEQFAVAITRAVNSALFIVVVLELVRTIIARLEGGGCTPTARVPRRLRHPGRRGSGVRRPAQLTDPVMWAVCPPGEHGLRGGKWDRGRGSWRGERS